MFDFQTTNYGLGGLCESHIDPSGEVMNKIEMGPDKNYIKATLSELILTIIQYFDYIGTKNLKASGSVIT